MPSGQAGMHSPQPLHWPAKIREAPSSGPPPRSSSRTPPITASGGSLSIPAVGTTGQAVTQAPQAVQALSSDREALSKYSASELGVWFIRRLLPLLAAIMPEAGGEGKSARMRILGVSSIVA